MPHQILFFVFQKIITEIYSMKYYYKGSNPRLHGSPRRCSLSSDVRNLGGWGPSRVPWTGPTLGFGAKRRFRSAVARTFYRVREASSTSRHRSWSRFHSRRFSREYYGRLGTPFAHYKGHLRVVLDQFVKHDINFKLCVSFYA